jgi:hypothetical protein
LRLLRARVPPDHGHRRRLDEGVLRTLSGDAVIYSPILTALQDILAALASASASATSTWAARTIATESVTGAAIGDATSFPKGILVTNLDASITIYLSDALAGLGADATRTELIPGRNASVVIPVASRAAIFAKSASGTPRLTSVAAS